MSKAYIYKIRKDEAGRNILLLLLLGFLFSIKFEHLNKIDNYLRK